MKNFLEKHWAVIIWVLTVALDEKYGLAEAMFSKAWQISLFQIFGTLALAYKWNPSEKAPLLNLSALADDTSDPIRSEHPKTRH